MTPTELDAIFRAWRDDVFAEWPNAKGWNGTVGELRCQLFARVNSWDETDDVIDRALKIGSAHWEDNYLTVRRPPESEQAFSFPDPPPLPASAPIPFPAGKALLEESPKAFSIGARVSCDKHAPEWEWNCDNCTWS